MLLVTRSDGSQKSKKLIFWTASTSCMQHATDRHNTPHCTQSPHTVPVCTRVHPPLLPHQRRQEEGESGLSCSERTRRRSTNQSRCAQRTTSGATVSTGTHRVSVCAEPLHMLITPQLYIDPVAMVTSVYFMSFTKTLGRSSRHVLILTCGVHAQ